MCKMLKEKKKTMQEFKKKECLSLDGRFFVSSIIQS